MTAARLSDAAADSVWNGVAAASDPDRPVAVGGDLDPATLIGAYRRGIFPYPPGNAQEAADLLPWWSPDPRGVIPVESVHLSRSLRARLRSCGWTTTVDRSFAQVVGRCGEGRASAWITPALAAAYIRLHAAGFAHSIEVWDGEELVGGLYGVLVGGVFMGESMFHRRSDASKAALADAASRLHQSGAAILDIQFVTAHLRKMGAVELPRDCFLGVLADVRDARIRLDTARQPVSRLVA